MPSLADRLLLSFFGAALFISAALLFLVQPMVARMILPFLGGSPAVWNTCLFFFQSLLLLGYLYAHFGSTWLGVKRHMALHLVVVVAALYFLPVSISPTRLQEWDAAPVFLVLGVLSVSVGFPFFVLSANAPLLQKWFSLTGHAAARDPYFLYAASNAGSLLGLLAYPLLLERWLTLAEQSRFWMYVYACFLALALACSWMVRRAPERPADAVANPESDLASHAFAAERSTARRLRWILLSFVPSSLLLGVTTYVTSDLASVPLLWVLPLSLYLISFIVAFRQPALAAHPFLVRRLGFLLLATAITFFAKATEPAAILLPLHLLTFFLTGLVCHGELAKDRPAPAYLTEYYLWISFGGLLGGFLNAFLSPLIFSSVLEYPLAIIVAAWILPPLAEQSSRNRLGRDILWPAILFVIVSLLVYWTRNHESLSAQHAHLLIFGTAALLGLSFVRHRTRFALGIGAILLATINYTGSFGAPLFTERSFFGVYRGLRDADGKFHLMFHGTTLHGAQSLDPATRLRPLSYYYPTGPAGQVFEFLSSRGFDKPVAIVGLGAGALACYARAGQTFDFYEIDPLVERIARDPDRFTFLRDCPAQAAVRIGDARVTLNDAADRFYGVLVLDAFSGDSIPIHLLTQEAVALYLEKLTADGVLLFHVSNRYLDLTQVVARLAQRLNLLAIAQHDGQISDQELADGKQPSTWVALSRRDQWLAPLAASGRWQPLIVSEVGAVWTDDHSNILQALR